jgi:hypothetical protein
MEKKVRVNGEDASGSGNATGILGPVMKTVAPPLIWMGIGFLAATWFYKPKRA